MTDRPVTLADESLIKVEELRFFHGDKCVFDDLNLTIPRHKITAIMGPSGIGKTTLLELFGGQLQAQSGRVLFNGISVGELSRKKLYALRRDMGILFQQGALFSDMNVYENVAFPLREHTDLPEDMIRDLVLLRLQAVGLRGAHLLSVSQLSGGMARRVALARAVMLDPMLMMYDEPFTGQDPIARGVLLKLIKELNDGLGLTTVLVSHDVEESARIADLVYVLSGGKVISAGPPQELLVSREPQVRQFIRGLPDGPVPFHYPASNDLQKDLGIGTSD